MMISSSIAMKMIILTFGGDEMTCRSLFNIVNEVKIFSINFLLHSCFSLNFEF